MPEPEAPAARSGATHGAAYSESASNGASMPTPIHSRCPKLAFFISLLGDRPGMSGGGAEGIRTPDPLLAKQVLSQLSYGPTALKLV